MMGESKKEPTLEELREKLLEAEEKHKELKQRLDVEKELREKKEKQVNELTQKQDELRSFNQKLYERVATAKETPEEQEEKKITLDDIRANYAKRRKN